MFKTQYKKHDRSISEAGDRMVIEYTPEYNRDGVLVLVKSGEHSLYDEIQSHRDSVDINVLLRQYQRGDIEALNRVQTTYGDFTNMPQTYSELLNSVIAGERYFDSLPIEVKKEFDYSFEKWLVSMDSPDIWRKRMGIDIEKEAEHISDIVPKAPVSDSVVTPIAHDAASIE